MICCVLTCKSATETAQRHWPFWREAFSDPSAMDEVVFIGCVDSECWHPQECRYWQYGEDRYNDQHNPDSNLCTRTLDVLEAALRTFQNQNDFCLIEYDVITLDRPEFTGEFSGTMFTERPFSYYFHPPWLFRRAYAQRVITRGRKLIRRGQIAGGWPDRHLGLIYHYEPCDVQILKTYSQNTLDNHDKILAAREAIEKGAWAIHGVKTYEQYVQLLFGAQLE